MATVSITIPDAVVGRVLDAVAAQYNYDPTPAVAAVGQPGQPGYIGPFPGGKDVGLTKAQFAKKVVAQFLEDVVRGYEVEEASRIAREAASDDVAADINIT